jgi:hypothetical protein
MVMWSNCMRFVGEEGICVGELENLARTKTNLNGMERWGYIVVEPGPSESRPPRSRWVIRATPKDRKAEEIWQPLFGVIEKRWKARFGKGEIEQLRESLCALDSQIGADLPDCLPILAYGLFSTEPDRGRRAPGARGTPDRTRGQQRFPSPSAGAPLARAAGFCHRVRARVGLVARDQRQHRTGPR